MARSDAIGSPLLDRSGSPVGSVSIGGRGSHLLRIAALVLTLFVSLIPVIGGAQLPPGTARSERLDQLIQRCVAAASSRFGPKGLSPEKTAITVIDLNDPDRPAIGSHRGQEPIYPASVVKLFYLVAAHNQLETGRLKLTDEIGRALHDMIVDSSNDATHYIVDVLTGTSAGSELEPDELRVWLDKRNAVNRYFAGLGYQKINVNQKPWCEGPYGRERQSLGDNYQNRNKLTTEATARLLYEIVRGRASSPERCHEMMGLLRRDQFAPSQGSDDQATAFSGKLLPPGSQYYSKAGWTSTTRHDAAYIRLPNGAEYILVVFTVDNSDQPDIIPFVSKMIADEFNQTRPKADLLLLHGKIWTGVPSKPWADALASRGERIVAVGSDDDVGKLAGDRARVIDLGGRLVLPGFIDGHTHFVTGGAHLLSVNLRDAATPEEFSRRIIEKAKQLPSGRWITGGDWDHELWPGAPLPTKELIDRFTPNNPVFVTRLDGHMGLANSAALKLARITRETKDPPGGTIVRDPATGEPTGILKDDAMQIINAVVPEPAAAESAESLTAALAEAARLGVTSIQDITPWPDYELYSRFRDAGKLTVRVYARTPVSSWKRQADLVGRQGRGDDWLRLGGIKAFMDGSLGSTTALFFEPFNDAPQTSGLMLEDNLPEGKLKKDIKEIDKAGLQCSIHAIGDRANDLLLNYFEEAARDNGPRDRRFRIEHAQHLLPGDIARFGRLGVIASMQPYHAYDDGRWAEKRIGPTRIKTTYAFRSLLDSGATLAFGSDWYVAPLSPLMGIYAAVTRHTADGKNPRGWVPEQKLTVEEAVRAYTAGCAYAEFAEREKGTLEAGKLADVVVLSQDIFRVNPDDIPKTTVVYTIVGGRIVYR
ncbi:MAG TPA: amidohydrolase family protein, partial [Blastocatellia bacterium]|nr:amidohydrolase family protein [Blastocatellia bacterium]